MPNEQKPGRAAEREADLAKLGVNVRRAAAAWSSAAPNPEWAAQLRRNMEQLAKFGESIQKTIEAATPALAQLQNQVQVSIPKVKFDLPEFSSRISKVIGPLSDAFAKLPKTTQNALENLSKEGWYLDPDMPISALWSLDAAIKADKFDEIEQQLCQYFRDDLAVIAERIAVSHARRKPIVEKAVRAHRNGDYELSVPVFLTQADGICAEAIGYQLYTRTKGVPRTAVYVQSVAVDSFRAALLHPLTLPLPLHASEAERGADFKGLNRHEVLHGQSTTYGTELNSLKALSLLSYISWVLEKTEVAS